MPGESPKLRPCIVIVRDGWGENPHRNWDHANAVIAADPAVDHMLRREWPFSLIATSGLDVGLPDGTMGNSEVGHQNLGAGRIVDQDAVRISKSMQSGAFASNGEALAVVQRAQRPGARLHLLGLVSDAGVHSRLEHLFGCLELAARNGLRDVCIHAMMDGRDSPPTAGIEYLRRVEGECARLGVGRVVSLCGRYWAMDRDYRWQRTEKAYRLLVEGAGGRFDSATAAMEWYYSNPAESNLRGDEFMPPTTIRGEGEAPVCLRDGDAAIFFNFRGDRPRQLVRALTLREFPYEGPDRSGQVRTMGFVRGAAPQIHLATLTAYEKGLCPHVLFEKPPRMRNIAGEYAASLGLRQFRAAETEKYAHVTFFFNDYREEPFAGEERLLVPSPTVETYDLKPEMSAPELTEGVLKRLAQKIDDLIVLNYANPDMVGHTGSLPAATRAVKTVDACVGRVLEAVRSLGGCAIVTADHGNAEQMIDPQTGGPHTSHTTYAVPLYLYGDAFRGVKLRDGGRLADVLPTALEMLGLATPPEMTGRPLMR